MANDSENVNRAVRLLREAADVLAQTNINIDTSSIQSTSTVAYPARRFSPAMQIFAVHWMWKQSICKEMHNDNNCGTKLLDWLRHWTSITTLNTRPSTNDHTNTSTALTSPHSPAASSSRSSGSCSGRSMLI